MQKEHNISCRIISSNMGPIYNETPYSSDWKRWYNLC